LNTHFSPEANSVTGATTETKFGTKVAYGVTMMPERQIHA